jgi:hypothetical protein
MRSLSIMLVILSIVFAIGGAVSLTQATLGVGCVCFGCFLAILARLAQASTHAAASRGETKPEPFVQTSPRSAPETTPASL